MKRLTIFDHYSKWFRVLNHLFIPVSILELLAIGTHTLAKVMSLISAIYFILFFTTFLLESLSRMIRYLLKSRH